MTYLWFDLSFNSNMFPKGILSMLIIERRKCRAKVGNQLKITERGSPMDKVPGTQPPNANPKYFAKIMVFL
jgi:hypothetical protein